MTSATLTGIEIERRGATLTIEHIIEKYRFDGILLFVSNDIRNPNAA